MSKEVVRLFVEASQENKVDTAVDCFAADGVWIDQDGNVYQGEAIRTYLTQQIGQFHDFQSQGVSVNFTELAEVGDTVFLGATINAADGQELRRFVDLFQVRDGKITLKDVFAKDGKDAEDAKDGEDPVD